MNFSSAEPAAATRTMVANRRTTPSVWNGLCCLLLVAICCSAPDARAQSVPVVYNNWAPAVSNVPQYIYFDQSVLWTGIVRQLTYTIDTQPAHGALTKYSYYCIYSNNPTYAGPDSFTWHVTSPDGTQTSVEATCWITDATNSNPVAANFMLITVPTITSDLYLYQNVAWVGGLTWQYLTYVIDKPPTQGVVTFPWPPNTYTCAYQCTNKQFIGTDTFTWHAYTNSQISGVATCSIVVVADPPPVARSFTYNISYGGGLTNYLTYFQQAYASGQTMTYHLPAQSDHGGVLTAPYGAQNSSFVYTSPFGFSGTDTFSWAISDGFCTSAPGVVSIVIWPPGPTPLTSFTNTIASGGTATNNLSYYASNPAGIPLTYAWGQPSNGFVAADAGDNTGALADYQPNPGFAGTNCFTWSVSNSFGYVSMATCTVVVTSSPPVALAQTVVTQTNKSLTIPLSYQSGGGYTCWPVRVSAVSATTGILTTNGFAFVFTPKTNWTGTDSFTWKMAYSNATVPLSYSAVVTCSIIVKDVGGNTNCDWTQWRFDECRTAQTPANLPAKLYKQWQRTLPVTAGMFDGMYYIWGDNKRDIDLCRPVQLGKHLFVPCLANDSLTDYNTDTGAQNWRYYAGGALRRPPLALALTNGTNVVIFGCDDGWLYCLNAADGSEVWKFRVAPNAKKAMGFGRLSSVWPIFGSPVACSNRIYAVAGYIPSWNLFSCCLDAASGRAIWQNDSAWLPASGLSSSLGPLSFSYDHTKIYGTSEGRYAPWMISPFNGALLGTYGSYQAKANNPGGFVAEPFWFVDGSGVNTISETMQSYSGVPNGVYTVTYKPLQIIAGGQTITSINAAQLGVAGTVGCMLAGDQKLFVTTTDGNLYCFGGSNTAPVIYANTVTPLPATTDAWTTVVQQILTNRSDLGQGLALVWGVGSGRLVTELAKQAPGLMIVAADPDFNKLQALRQTMDAAGCSGARVSTVQGNPMDCGFAPYQAALIVSEDVNIAGFSSNVMGMATRAYKCTRPFGGEIWLPTSNAQYSAIANGLSAANLPTCNGAVSYSITFRSDVTVPGTNGFTQIRRLGLPDASLALKPPFRLTAFCSEDTAFSTDPSVLPVKGTKSGVDIYSWLPVSASEDRPQPTVLRCVDDPGH